MKFHFEDTLPLSLPIYKRCDNIVYENKFNIHAAKFFSTDLPSVILSIETISFFDLLFGKFQCLSIWNEWSNPPRSLIFWFDGVVGSCNHSKKEKCCSFVPLWGFLSVYELMTFLYLSKKLCKYIWSQIFFYSHESRFHILLVWQPAIVPNFQRVFFLFHESENTLAFFKRIFSFV